MAGSKKKSGGAAAASSNGKHESKEVTSNGKEGGSDKKKKKSEILPLWKRPSDVLFVFWFFNFWFSVMFTDLHNFTASYRGVEVKDLEGREDMAWPPKILSWLYFRWARTVDPLLYENPIWWQCIEWVNLLCLMPFSIAAMWAFTRGSNWIRTPGIIVSSFTFYSLILCMGSTLFGPTKSADPMMFIAVYVPYLIFPACVVVRLWHDRPFNKKTTTCCGRFVHATNVLVMLATYALYFTYIVIWFRRHTTWLDAYLGPLGYEGPYAGDRDL